MRHQGLQLLSKYPHYRKLWLSSVITQCGDQIGWVALIWLVLHRTHSSSAIGWVTLAYQIPQVVTAPLAGVIQDKFQRAKVMALGNVLFVFLFTAIPLISMVDPMGNMWLIYLLITTSGVLLPLTGGASPLIAQLIAKEDLSKANFFHQSAWQIAYLLGPALGGILIAWVGSAPVLFIDAASFLICAALLNRIPVSAQGASREGAGSSGLVGATRTLSSTRADFAEGIRYLMRQPALLALALLTLLFYFFYGPYEVILPILAKTQFGGAEALGLLWSSFAVGTAAGSVVFSAKSWPFRLAPSLATVIILWGVVTMGLAYASSLITAAIVMFLGGLVFSPWGPLSATARQRLVPMSLQGRVFGATAPLTTVGMPLGAWLCGLFLGALSVQTVLLWSGAATIAVGVWGLCMKTFRDLDRVKVDG